MIMRRMIWWLFDYLRGLDCIHHAFVSSIQGMVTKPQTFVKQGTIVMLLCYDWWNSDSNGVMSCIADFPNVHLSIIYQ